MESKTAVKNIERYASYKDSGVEWLGEIPENWQVKPGLTILNESKEKNIGFIQKTVLSLSYGNVIVKPKEKLTGLVPESFETYQLVKPGDIIIRPTDLQNDKTSLRTGLAKDHGIITSAYINLRVKEKYSNSFYHYYLHTIDINKVIYGLGSGLRQNISFWDFKRFPFPFPPLPEQTAIAQFLDDKTSKIEDAIAIKEQQISLLKERKQILIHQAVTRGLDNSVTLKNAGVEWIGEIPEHWEVKALKFISNLQSGEFISSDDFKEEGYPVYGGNGFRAYCENYTNDGLYALIGRQGALCGNVNYADGKFYATEHAVVVYPINNEDTLWLGETIKVADFNRLSQSAAQPGIAVGVIKNERFPYPPLSEQKEISAYIETASEKIETAIALKQQEIEKLTEYKSSLINGVVTGKVRVC
ncbi:type I restriction enzyme S subunit [Nonlabens dokdonensis]|uniref:Type I restriction-modification system S(Specificity) subunit n=2 Tax=Nonlabens dokdonensis TaxID=328515 RepID=L7W751_NONDD|nr:restriction endonuclease subunit S [Nonlabens dokdonensis]AGC75954.1 type I restriction-modification system S(specificity) subunit [Nonlabens dokdonensis DSW-6]PZX43631.1 type I restriction enzyme S subunit [Nonlabens dokdonensis]